MDTETLQYKKMTETPIPRLIITLGIPTTISMLVTSIYNMADTYFVGGYGDSASGAIGVVFGLMSIIQAFGFMFGQGSGVLGSQRMGAGDTKRASQYASTGFFSALMCGGIIAVAGLILLDPLMYLLGSTDTILPHARGYAIFILLAAPFMCSSCVLNNVLRFEGRAAFAMIGLTSGGLLNIFGDWLLMNCFHMGTVGAGIATAVSQVISFFILLSMFLRGKTAQKLSVNLIPREINTLFEICKTGFPSLLRQGLTSISTMLLNDCAKAFGDAAIAAMSVVNRICMFTFSTALGIGQGFQPVCAFNYGAKKYGRVIKAFLFTFAVGELLLGSAAIIGFGFAEQLVALFRDSEEVVRIGSVALIAQFVGQIFQPITVCANMMFQSVGRAKTAALLAVLRNGLFFIPVLLILSSQFGLVGVQISQGVADVLSTAVSVPFSIVFLLQLKRMEKEQQYEIV